MLRVHRVPFSTNVERVALAAGHKGLAVEWVDHTFADRAAVRALSGQDLVPVAELNPVVADDRGEVVVDSMVIVERLEALAPDPPLYPRDPAARARTDVFVAWFNRVWKGPPNAIEAEEARDAPDRELIERLGAELTATRDVFEGLLADGPYLLGESFGAADVCAFPFLKWAVEDGVPDGAPYFEEILVRRLALGDGFPRLRAWIERVDGHPRA